MIESSELEHRFEHHPPTSDLIANDHEAIRKGCMQLAHLFNGVVPGNTREAAMALTKLEEAMMWANAGIARHQTGD